MSMFDYQHKNPPAPFNPDYRPYANDLTTDVINSLEAEGFYDKYTLAERKTMDNFKVRWAELKPPYELEYQRVQNSKMVVPPVGVV
ncbi:hypothetical protein GD1_22 [Paraglaciecola Antarctic GD virus 1]|nr:hypothetical protein GD1_22 [Paraglaciecola Antarctic GD virus 1]